MPKNPQLEHDKQSCELSARTLRVMDAEIRAHFKLVKHLRAETCRVQDALPGQIKTTRDKAREFRAKWGFDWWEEEEATSPPSKHRATKREDLERKIAMLKLPPDKAEELMRILTGD